MKHLVYCHTRNDTNEIFYVGKGTPTRSRTSGSRNKYWKHVVTKAGGFKVHIIAANLFEQEALNFEILLIKKLREQNVKLTNITAGGEGTSGIKLSEEHKQKLRKAHLGKKLSPEHIAKCVASKLGKKYTAEQKQNISNSLKGRKLSTSHKAKLSKQIVCLTNNKEYPSVTAAAKELGLETTNISKCCKGVFKQTKGYTFKYKAITS